MPFRFKLESVLKLRRAQEEARRLELTRIQQQRVEVRRQLEEIRQARERSVETLARDLQGGLTANEVHFQVACQDRLEAQRRSLASRQEQLEAEHADALETFARSRRKRETLEKLSDDAREAYEREATRREQRAQDERYLSRRPGPS